MLPVLPHPTTVGSIDPNNLRNPQAEAIAQSVLQTALLNASLVAQLTRNTDAAIVVNRMLYGVMVNWDNIVTLLLGPKR